MLILVMTTGETVTEESPVPEEVPPLVATSPTTLAWPLLLVR